MAAEVADGSRRVVSRYLLGDAGGNLSGTGERQELVARQVKLGHLARLEQPLTGVEFRRALDMRSSCSPVT